MEDSKADLVSSYNNSSMREFYRQFRSPESQSSALKILEKSGKVAGLATRYLNQVMEKNRPHNTREYTMEGGGRGSSQELEKRTRILKAQGKFQSRMTAIATAKDNALQRVILGQRQSRSQGRGRSLSDEFRRGR